MSDAQEQLARVVRLVVDEPDAVEINEVPDGRVTVLQLHVAENDLGQVIGRQGRTARAFRSLLAARGSREGHRYELEILDD
jgi:predicted RNA-binding protein YlqC (UPF0109 family)